MEDKGRELDLRFARLVSGFAPEEQRDMVWVIETNSDVDVRGYEMFKERYFKDTWDSYIMGKYVNKLDNASDDNPAIVADNIVALKRQFEASWHNKHEYRLSDAVDAAAHSIINEILLPEFRRGLDIEIQYLYQYLRRSNMHYSVFSAAVGTRLNAEYFSRMVYKPAAKLSGSRSYMQGNSAARSALRQSVLLKLHIRRTRHKISEDLVKLKAFLARMAGVSDSDSVELWTSKHRPVARETVYSYDLFRPSDIVPPRLEDAEAVEDRAARIVNGNAFRI
jgi:hypothetical protein